MLDKLKGEKDSLQKFTDKYLAIMLGDDLNAQISINMWPSSCGKDDNRSRINKNNRFKTIS